MKKSIYGALFGLILAIVIFSAGASTNGAPVLTYVYSNSMEPLIKVNDGFIVWPTTKWQVGDIVVYRPVVLKAPYITHRIIAVGETGYITKGDNSSYDDQESGEPEVMPDRIVGKVVAINGQPLVFPGLGSFSASAQLGLGKYSKYLSAVFLTLGIITALMGSRHSPHRLKPRRRLRLRHVYRMIVLIAVGSVVFSVYLGSRVTQIKYLVSEYPGKHGNQVEVNQAGQLTMVVRNNGLVPIWNISTGIVPLSVHDAPEYIWSQSEEEIVLDILPQHQTGIYQGYVQLYNYPILLPRTWIVYLHRIHPALAIIAIGIILGLWFALFFKVLNCIHGFEEWIPLRAIKDKMIDRRFKRARAKFLGRRRAR